MNTTTKLPTTVTVELDWDDLMRTAVVRGMDYEGEPVYGPAPSPEALILDRAADKLVESMAREDRHDLSRTVRDTRQAVIREIVTKQVMDTLDAPVQKTNSYGEPVGEATTLRALVIAEVTNVMTRKEGGDYRREGMTLLQRVIKDETEAAFRKELADELAKVKAQLSGIITERAAKVLGDALVEATADNSLTAKTAAAVTR